MAKVAIPSTSPSRTGIPPPSTSTWTGTPPPMASCVPSCHKLKSVERVSRSDVTRPCALARPCGGNNGNKDEASLLLKSLVFAVALLAVLPCSTSAHSFQHDNFQESSSMKFLSSSGWSLVASPLHLAESLLQTYGEMASLLIDLDQTLYSVYSNPELTHLNLTNSNLNPNPIDSNLNPNLTDSRKYFNNFIGVPQTGAMQTSAERSMQRANAKSGIPSGTPSEESTIPVPAAYRAFPHLAAFRQWTDDTGPMRGRHLVERMQGSVPDINLEPYPLPQLALDKNQSNVTVLVLARNRTDRTNPLNGFKTYDGGWDFFNGSYWASLAWSTSAGAFMGAAWTLLGIGYVFILFLICCCCGDRWKYMRDDTLRYSRCDCLVPLMFLVFGVLTAGAGLGIMISGGLQFNQGCQNLTGFAVSETTRITNIILNVTHILSQVNNTQGSLNITLPDNAAAKLQDVLNKANSAAKSVQSTAQSGGNKVDSVLNTLQTILFVVGCITVGFVALGLIFGLLKWVVMSNIVTVILWLLIAATWVLVTIFVFIWLFNGDTAEATHEVSKDPMTLSKFSLLLPCANPQLIGNLGAFTRYIGFASIVVVNNTIEIVAPGAFRALKAPGGICNPFKGPPQYALDNTTCLKPPPCAHPHFQKCQPKKIDFRTLSQMVINLPCNQTNKINKECVSPELQALIFSGLALYQNIGQILPLMQEVFHCAYIMYLAGNISNNTATLENSAIFLWVGFLLIAVGAMIASICLPIYAYRAVRSHGVHDGEAEEVRYDNDEWDVEGAYKDHDEEHEEEDEDEDDDVGRKSIKDHRRHDEDEDDYEEEEDDHDDHDERYNDRDRHRDGDDDDDDDDEDYDEHHDGDEDYDKHGQHRRDESDDIDHDRDRRHEDDDDDDDYDDDHHDREDRHDSEERSENDDDHSDTNSRGGKKWGWRK